MENKRYVYGTKTKEWYLVDESDRDFCHGIPFNLFHEIGEVEAKELYLRAVKL